MNNFFRLVFVKPKNEMKRNSWRRVICSEKIVSICRQRKNSEVLLAVIT